MKHHFGCQSLNGSSFYIVVHSTAVDTQECRDRVTLQWCDTVTPTHRAREHDADGSQAVCVHV